MSVPTTGDAVRYGVYIESFLKKEGYTDVVSSGGASGYDFTALHPKTKQRVIVEAKYFSQPLKPILPYLMRIAQRAKQYTLDDTGDRVLVVVNQPFADSAKSWLEDELGIDVMYVPGNDAS